MTSPHYKPIEWKPARLAEAMRVRKLDKLGLRNLINKHRAEHGNFVMLASSTIRDQLDGKSDPTFGRTGSRASVFELATVLDVSLDWLCGRVPFRPVIRG